MMRISRRVLALGTIAGVLVLIPAGAVAAPPPKDGEPGHGNGANQPAGQANDVSQPAGPETVATPPAGQGNGTNQPPGQARKEASPPAQGRGTNQPPGQARKEAPPSGDGHGANQPGPYDPNGVGQPSGNGKSENNNGKRPCAGCVGNADAKNPPGQMPGGSDRNAGYECDRNQGVGKTNPAHSGCGAAPPNPPEQPPKQPPGGGPPEQPPAAGAPQQPAAQGEQAPEKAPKREAAAVLPESAERGAPAEEAPEGRPVKLEKSAGHPFTGSRVLVLLGLGLLALAVGFGTRRLGSRRGA